MSTRKGSGSQKSSNRNLRTRNIDDNIPLRIINVDQSQEQKGPTVMTPLTKKKQPTSKEITIPTPEIQVFRHKVPDRGRGRFRLPEHYIKFRTRAITGDLIPTDHYSLSKDDLDWLNDANRPPRPLNCKVGQMEALIFWFEKLAYKNGCCKGDPRNHLDVYAARGAVNEVLNVDEFICEEVYNYWVAKRLRQQKALVRGLQVPPPPSNEDPNVAFRRRTVTGDRQMSTRHRTKNPRKNDREAYKRLLVLKRDLTNLGRIVKLIQMREDWKHQQLLIENEMLDLNLQLNQYERKGSGNKTVVKDGGKIQRKLLKNPLPRSTFNEAHDKWNIEKICWEHESAGRAIIEPWSHNPFNINDWVSADDEKLSTDDSETENEDSDQWAAGIFEEVQKTDAERIAEVLDHRVTDHKIHLGRLNGHMFLNVG